MSKIKSEKDSVGSKLKNIFFREHDCLTDGHIYGPYTTMFFRFSPIEGKAMIKQFQADVPVPIFKEESQMRSCTSCGFFDYLNVDWTK